VDLPWVGKGAPNGMQISHGIRKAFRRLLAMRDDGRGLTEFLVAAGGKGQTAGNAPFAMWYASKFGGNVRWFNRLDVVPCAWSHEGLKSIKSLFPGGPSCSDDYRVLVDLAMVAARPSPSQVRARRYRVTCMARAALARSCRRSARSTATATTCT
jgi:hypothetical protein